MAMEVDMEVEIEVMGKADKEAKTEIKALIML